MCVKEASARVVHSVRSLGREISRSERTGKREEIGCYLYF